MNRQEYTDRVLAALRRVTPQERMDIRAELDAHMEDHICALVELGYDEQLAEERTLSHMGDPEEVGRELDKQYPLHWLMISRIATAALIVLLVLTIINLGSLHGLYESIQTRIAPWSGVDTFWEDDINYRMDIQQEIGSDLIKILGSGTKSTETEATAYVFYCQCDQNVLGYRSRFPNEQFTDCRGEELWDGGSSYSNARVSYVMREMEVQYGDPYITMILTRYDESYEIQIPLVWGAVP